MCLSECETVNQMAPLQKDEGAPDKLSAAIAAESLRAQRIASALASGGISSNIIYGRVIEIIQSLHLTGHVLDFGCGIGNLLQLLLESKRFNRVTGIDLVEKPERIPTGIQYLSADLNADITKLGAEEFDLICAVEIIEHLENPRHAFREFSRMLKYSGTLIVTTPNNLSIRSMASLLLRGWFSAFGDESYPAHITALLKIDLLRIATENGFIQHSFFYTNSGYIPRTQIKWQDIAPWFKGRLFSDNLIFVCTKRARETPTD